MKFEWNRKASTIAAYAFIVLALGILFFHLLSNSQAVTTWLYGVLHPIFPIFYGFVVAYLLNPIMVWFEALVGRLTIIQRLGRRHRRGLAMLLTYLLTLAVITSFAFIVLPRVFESIAQMASQIQNYVASAERFVTDTLERIPEGLVPETYIQQVTDMVGKAVSDLISLIGNSVPAVLGLAVNIGSGVIGVVMGIIVSIYLLYSKEKFIAQLRKALCAFLPKRRIDRVMAVTRTTDHMFGRFITGKIVDSIIIGILCFLGMSLIRLPNVVLVSFIIGLTNVIPYFGPFLGAIPSFFLIAFISLPKALIFLVFILVLQQLDGNVIGPMILGDSTGLSAFWVVFAILFFGGTFGIMGMFIGVPTFGVIYWLIKERILVLLAEKGMPLETEAYLQPFVGESPLGKLSDENNKK